MLSNLSKLITAIYSYILLKYIVRVSYGELNPDSNGNVQIFRQNAMMMKGAIVMKLMRNKKCLKIMKQQE